MFYRPKKCESCGHKIYPIKDEKGNLIINNLFKVDLMSILMIIGLLLLVFGVRQINDQCYQIVEDPCKFTHDQYGNDKCTNLNPEVNYGSFEKIYPTGSIG